MVSKDPAQDRWVSMLIVGGADTVEDRERLNRRPYGG